MDLAQQRCFNHAGREAVARCPECRHYYCRECITEHEGRVLCASCLAEFAAETNAPRRAWRHFLRPVEWVAAIVMTWFFFYFVGRMLLLLPDSFHDGSFWRELGI